MSMLSDATKWLHDQAHDHLADTITYRRGEQEVSLAATVGRSEFEIERETGVIVSFESRDYIFRATDLVLGGATVEPADGDRIVEAGRIYEVLAPGDHPAWRWSDPFRTAFRVHTKYIGLDS